MHPETGQKDASSSPEELLDYRVVAEQTYLPFRLQLVVPSPSLARFVEAMFVFEQSQMDAGRFDYAWLPDGTCHLAFAEFYEIGDRHSSYDLTISGAHDRLLPIPLRGARRVLIVRVRPGAFAELTNLHPHEFTNATIHFSDVCSSGVDGLIERLAAVPAARQIDLLTRFLQRRDGRFPKSRPDVGAGIDIVRRNGGAARTAELAMALGCSNRHLARVFHDRLGLSPKAFLKTLRLARVLRHTRPNSRALDWPTIALECGYYDHSHLVREFREYTGMAPGRLIASTPFPEILCGRVLLRPHPTEPAALTCEDLAPA